MLDWVGLKEVWATPVLWAWIHAMACVELLMCAAKKNYTFRIELFFADDFFSCNFSHLSYSINYCKYLMNEANEARSVQQSRRTISVQESCIREHKLVVTID
jgi:hypothetical protein